MGSHNCDGQLTNFMQKEKIAIIGMGCRFPGKLNDVESFWKFLLEGREAVEEVPGDRWNVDRFYDTEPGIAGKTIAKRGGFVEGLDQFDPQFFGISPREAAAMDPQQRMLLEAAWQALDPSQYSPTAQSADTRPALRVRRR